MAHKLHPDLKVSRKDQLGIDPADLIVDREKRGREFPPEKDAIVAMAESIKTHGQIQPCPVRVTHDRYLSLEAGFTRWEAFMYLNEGITDPAARRQIRVVIVAGNDQEMFLTNLAENRDRNGTTEIDDAGNARRLERDFGKTDDEIRLIFSNERDAEGKPKLRSAQWLAGLRELLTLTREQQEAIHRGHISSKLGRALARLAPEIRASIWNDSFPKGGRVMDGTDRVDSIKLAKAVKAASSTQSDKPAKLQPKVERAVWTHLKEHASPKTACLADLVLEFKAGKISDRELINGLSDLLGEPQATVAPVLEEAA